MPPERQSVRGKGSQAHIFTTLSSTLTVRSWVHRGKMATGNSFCSQKLFFLHLLLVDVCSVDNIITI